ncbi:hypothetical protein PY092_15145 [Muricauda sp. 334s03]|uniref:Uncharacterized protein n=1 Tax=Flagellimonas yonaguniensis TaxID=3031325 RepID=A0ABT5Y228_9FLAO|nr:hypothetical protein [[Muricauda] yonaguniensis]MDF0717499.1 hypothetical protein [[Muricauda] yonaguniensis]
MNSLQIIVVTTIPNTTFATYSILIKNTVKPEKEPIKLEITLSLVNFGANFLPSGGITKIMESNAQKKSSEEKVIIK